MRLLRESPAIVARKDFRDPRDGAFPTALSVLRGFPVGVWDGTERPGRLGPLAPPSLIRLPWLEFLFRSLYAVSAISASGFARRKDLSLGKA